jgi:hypothetical protein
LKSVIELISQKNNQNATFAEIRNMEDIINKCFVCGQPRNNEKNTINHFVNLPVCANCKNTENEKQKVEELLESLSEGFVCGCI